MDVKCTMKRNSKLLASSENKKGHPVLRCYINSDPNFDVPESEKDNISILEKFVILPLLTLVLCYYVIIMAKLPMARRSSRCYKSQMVPPKLSHACHSSLNCMICQHTCLDGMSFNKNKTLTLEMA